jgi:hypothetical protein
MSKKTTTPKGKKPQKVRRPGAQSVPVARGYLSSACAPKYSSTSDGGGISISRTEFVGSVTNGSTTGFSLSSVSASTPGFDFNPACGTLFPWLSSIAQNYEKFRFTSLRFRLIPSQASSTPGRVYMAIDYDYDDAVPTSKLMLMSNRTVQEAPVWEEVRLVADAKSLQDDMPWRYVTTNSRMNFQEPRTAYCGYLIIGFDSTATNLLYDMEVSYTVDLKTPVLDASSLVDNSADAPVLSTTSLLPRTVGGVFGREVLPDTPLPAGSQVKSVLCGSNGVPTMNLLGVSGAAATMALDLARVTHKSGVLSFLSDIVISGVTPSAAIPQTSLYSGGIYNSAGAHLGNIAPGSTPGCNYLFGSGPSYISTSGGILNAVSKFSLSGIFSQYPSARYLIPLVSAGTQWGAGTSKTSMQFEL